MSKKVLIMGGEGNAVIIADAIKHANSIGANEIICHGLLNDNIPTGHYIGSFPVVGKVQDIQKFIDDDYYFINTIYRIDGQKERLDMFSKLNIPYDKLVIFIHPFAYVAPSVQISPGTVIMPHVSVSSDTSFGIGNIILQGATVGHDNQIGDFCHISSQACVGSFLKIGTGVHIGLNATIREHLKIGNYATIGMGAVLTKEVGDNEIWVGNPAKFLRKAK